MDLAAVEKEEREGGQRQRHLRRQGEEEEEKKKDRSLSCTLVTDRQTEMKPTMAACWLCPLWIEGEEG